MSRRANGLGTVSLRKDGRYVVAVTHNGKRHYRYAKSRKEAELQLARLLTELQDAPVPTPEVITPGMPSLSQWAKTFLEHCQTTRRPGTVSTYRQCLKRVIPALGSYPLDKLTPAILAEYYSRQPAGKRVVQNSYVVLKTCLEMAVDHGYLSENPLSRVDKPKWRYLHPQLWTQDQYRRFMVTALESDRTHSSLFAFLACTGLRISEALALEWRNVSTVVVHVNKALVHVDGKWYELPPKTTNGFRQVSLPGWAVMALDDLPRNRLHVFFDNQPPGYAVLGRQLRKLCADAGVPRVTVHQLRHIAAVMALQMTKDLHAVQRRLGHSSPSITLDIYGYAFTEDEAVSRALDKLMEAPRIA